MGINNFDVTARSIAAMHTVSLDYSGGFGSASSAIAINNNASLVGSGIQLTTNVNNQRGSAWYNLPVPVSAFSTTFTFQIASGGTADGMTFCIQKNATTTIGTGAGYLGIGSMPNSCAVKFDLYSNNGEGTTSTGVYLNGAQPYNTGSFSMSGNSVNLRGGNVMRCTLVYDGTTLSQTVVDTVTNATFTKSYTVDIPTAISGTTAYVGFTGATGGASAIQTVQTWTYTAPNALSVVQ
ncbi:MAG: L-type lectin-domain containing protein [Tepidisphaeraceae bacterium]